MKLMFMFCNNCIRMAVESKNWLVDHKNCTCIFLEEHVEPEGPASLNQESKRYSPAQCAQVIIAEIEREQQQFIRGYTKTLNPEQLEQFKMENGFL